MLALLTAAMGWAAETGSPGYPIDLAAVLRLAGAQNLEVQIAREQLKEAEANHSQARAQFFPWIAPGVGYRRHEGRLQDVAGNILDVEKQSYTAGAAITAQVDLGDAIYKSLAARQLVTAAQGSLDAKQQETLLAAAAGYFELARAKAAMGAAQESVRIAENFSGQVARAVEAGIAFKGDAQRAEVQVQKNRMLLRQAEEQRQTASARLAQTLHLDIVAGLDPQDSELAPLSLVASNAPLASLVSRALAARPELRQRQALAASARNSSQGAKYGPLVPTLGAQASVYGLGGGKNSDWGNFSDGEDYFLGLSWRIGPGGLFDESRIRAAKAREASTSLELERSRDDITRQVVEAKARVDSLGDQLTMGQRALAAAAETHRLSQERKEFGVGAVLETIQAEQELTRARLDYLGIVAENNAAQFRLERAVGGLSAAP